MGYSVRTYGRSRTKKNGRKYKDWYVIVSRDGKEIETERANPNTEAAAKRLKFEKEQKLRLRTYVPDSESITVGEAAPKWLEWFDGTTRGPNRKHSSSSYRTRESVIRCQIIPKFGNVKITQLTAPMLQEWIDELTVTLKGGTVGDIYGTLGAICTHADQRLGLGVNPLRGLILDLPEKHSKSADQVPMFADVEFILKYLDQPKPEGVRLIDWVQYPVIIGLCALAGLRRGEMAGIDAEHLDLDGFWIKVDQQLKENGEIDLPKFRKTRVVKLDPVLHFILIRYRAFLGKWSGPLFLDHNGKRCSAAWVAARVERLMKMVGLVNDVGENKFSTHGFRHFAGSAWIMQGMPINIVSDYLGHASTAFTEKVYIHELEDLKNLHGASLQTMAGMFPGLAQSAIPVIAEPMPLPALRSITPSPERIVANTDGVIAAEAIPDVDIPARAAQWIPYAVRLLQAGWEVKDVAKELGYGERNFQWAFNRAGLTPGKIQLDAKKARTKYLRENGHNRSEIARIVHVNWSSADRWSRIDRTYTDKLVKKAQ